MKTLIGLVLTMAACTTAMANPALVTNPYLPYPAGCAQMPDLDAPGGLESRAVKFYEQELEFYSSQAGDPVPLTLRMFRAPCSEPNRSLVWLEFILAAQYSGQDLDIQLPTVVAEIAPDHRRLMSLATEPNGWGSEGWVDREAMYLSSWLQGLRWYYGLPAGERRWVFLLDNGPPFPNEFYEYGLTPTEYNEAFKLVLRYIPYDFLTIDVPATQTLLPTSTPRMPFSGRLSGNWVIPGAADQGLLLSVSEEVLPDIPGVGNSADMPLVVFLAHYTFDGAGNMLWLTGAAKLQPGAVNVTIPIEMVTDGAFRSNKPAARQVIGSVTLKSFSCNDLRFEYDYSGIGLGSGEERLERLFSLETAGHECRDYEARMTANN